MNPLEPRDIMKGCGANTNKPDVDAFTLQAAAKFLNTIDPPTAQGLMVRRFSSRSGVRRVIRPSMPGPGVRQQLAVYTDLLLHDLGAALDDRMTQGPAQGNEWRTPPLWMESEREKLMHDGRLVTLPAAIGAHGGQGQAAADAFAALDAVAQDALMTL